jgi:hypothetical protein
MMRLKCVLAAFLCVLMIPVLTVPVLGWEFQMTGSMIWAYEFYNQSGAQGFFGPYNVDRGANTTTANLNYWWNGPRIAQNIVTGQDASKSYFYVLFDPSININPALKFQGRIRLGQWNNPWASYNLTQSVMGTDNAFSEAQFTMFWATASLPWGTFGIGKRPWKFGTGLQYDGSDGLTTESMVLNVPYGPFDFGLAFYPHRPTNQLRNIFIDWQNPRSPVLPAQPIPGDPYNLIASPYFNTADKSGVIISDFLLYAVYSSGPLQTGILGSYGGFHIGPEAQLLRTTPPPTPPSPAPGAPALAQDSEYFHGTVFEKYNNGRFFFNAELAWLYWTDRLSGTALVDPSNPANPVNYFPRTRYTEQWRYMVETGVLAGPAKVTLLNAWTPGPDRRNSNLFDKQPAAFVWHPTFDTLLGNYDVFRPYSFILSYNYGGGFNAYNLSLDGYMRDAWVLATRLDYAVASNLNVYGTFFWAERTAKGYGWACIAPNDPNMPPQFVATGNDGFVQFVVNGAAGSPNIPDTALGWEANAGVDWQLLEGYTLGFLVGYWKPGKWFNYACVDRSVPSWNVPGTGNFWGTRPDKSIDPVIAGQCTMNFSF